MMRSVIFVVVMIGGALLGTWAGDRSPTTETRSAEATPREVRAGEALRIAYEFRRYRLCPRQTERTIFDGDGVKFDLGVQDRPYPGPIGADSYIQPILVPTAAAPGAARYRVAILDFCNPLHRIWPLRKVIEIDFEILPGLPFPSPAP